MAYTEYSEVTRRTLLQGGAASLGVTALLGAVANLVDSLSAATLAVRKAAHNLNAADPEVKVLRDAIKVMRDRGNALDGWTQMSFYHRDFCDTGPAKQIHFSWFFLPWHRFELVIVERFLQAAISEPTLALLYWDWYAHRKIPDIYVGQNNPLADLTRIAGPGAQMQDDDFGDAIRERDLITLRSFGEFAGGAPFNSGRLEAGPHGGGHVFVGGNMGAFATAALDPIFYAHHGNIDRLWEVWRNADPANHKDPVAGSAWDSRPHSFTDVEGSMRIWKSSDAVSTEALGYRYDNIDPKEPLVIARRGGAIAVPASANVEIKIPLAANGGDDHNYTLGGGGLTVKPNLPATPDGLSGALSSTSTAELLQARRLYLLVDGIKLPTETAYVHIHINLAGTVTELTREISRDKPSYAGSVNLVPTGPDEAERPSINLRIDLTNRARSLNTTLSDLSIVIVPFRRDGQRLAQSTSVEKLQLLVE
jgi:polyphenol oxidase